MNNNKSWCHGIKVNRVQLQRVYELNYLSFRIIPWKFDAVLQGQIQSPFATQKWYADTIFFFYSSLWD